MTMEQSAIATDAGGLCTLAQVKARLNKTTSDYDDRIDALIAALLPTVNARYGREFMPGATTKRTFPVTSRFVSLGASDLRTVTTVKLHPETTSPTTLAENTDYALMPVGADPLTGTYGAIRLAGTLSVSSDFLTAFGVAQLEIDGAWGCWTTVTDVPEDINTAAIECVLAWINKPVAQIGVLGSGEPRQVEPAVPSTWDIPSSAHRKFQAYNRVFGCY